MSLTYIIEQQKSIADEVLKKLTALDPNAILAGGAPRDWAFNKSANDLDIYLYLPYETIAENLKRFEAVGLNGFETLYTKIAEGRSEPALQSQQYKSMETLQRVYEGFVDNQKVQLMIVNQFVYPRVLRTMSCSICQFYYKDKKIKATKEALLGIWHGFNILGEGYTEDSPHVKKVEEYYPEYDIISNESIEVLTKIAAKQLEEYNPKSVAFSDKLQEEVFGKMLNKEV